MIAAAAPPPNTGMRARIDGRGQTRTPAVEQPVEEVSRRLSTIIPRVDFVAETRILSQEAIVSSPRHPRKHRTQPNGLL